MNGTGGNIVQFDNVGLRYGTGKEILSDMSFTLHPGRFYFLTGASGAGKTSLLRLLYLGHVPSRLLEIFTHQACNGALLLFAFFMISDPMTLPDRPLARRLHVMLVAVAGFAWQFLNYRPNGALWALFYLAPLVPLWDAI